MGLSGLIVHMTLWTQKGLVNSLSRLNFLEVRISSNVGPNYVRYIGPPGDNAPNTTTGATIE